MRRRHCRGDIQYIGTDILEPKQHFADVIHKVVIAGHVIISQLQKEFASGRNFDIVAVQFFACLRYTIENSTLCRCVLDVRLGDNIESEFAGQHEV